MKIKKFEHITFEEWEKNGKEYTAVLGAYCYNIGPCIWGHGITVYIFSFHIYNINTDSIFSKVYDDYNDYGDIEKLKEWYNKTIDEFDDYWQNLINSTYLKE